MTKAISDEAVSAAKKVLHSYFAGEHALGWDGPDDFIVREALLAAGFCTSSGTASMQEIAA